MRFFSLTREESGRYVVGKKVLHCGDAIALRWGGQILSGRVEWDDRLGWYFINQRRLIRLIDGDSVALI